MLLMVLGEEMLYLLHYFLYPLLLQTETLVIIITLVMKVVKTLQNPMVSQVKWVLDSMQISITPWVDSILNCNWRLSEMHLSHHHHRLHVLPHHLQIKHLNRISIFFTLPLLPLHPPHLLLHLFLKNLRKYEEWYQDVLKRCTLLWHLHLLLW